MNQFEAGTMERLHGYPGRGIVVWRLPDNDIRWIYFITGRSTSSRNRAPLWDGTALIVAPSDAASEHDDLRHYECAVKVPGSDAVVVGNGDHVPVIAAALGTGQTLESALGSIEPEPDPPINTPRIAALLRPHESTLCAVLDQNGSTVRQVIGVPETGHDAVIIHTYSGTIEHPTGSAPRFALSVGSDDLPKLIWEALDPGLRVFLCSGGASNPEPDVVLTAG